MMDVRKDVGLYRPEDEHDACGVGFVASIDGRPRREVVWAAINALENVWHRGAVDADGKTGDGAGLMVQVPQEFFRDHAVRTGHRARKDIIGVGMTFLPRTDMEAQEAARAIVETEILKTGYIVYGWRHVPVDVSVIGEKAGRTRPEIEQILIGNNGRDEEAFERDLYVIRRRIENAIRRAQIQGFYICSLSCRSIVYKGLFLAEQISKFYPDLRDNRFESNFAIFHQRYSTNTFPTWHLAQPFRCLAHNGEINTLSGNLNWMKVHETRMSHECFGEAMDDLKPVVPHGLSDSGALDAVFELMCQAGRDAPMVKSMLVPEAYLTDETMPQEHKAFYMYCNTVMEPWDGPAALALYDGRWVVGGMDRNGLRPCRYTITQDGLIVAGSETGMVALDETKLVEKGRLGPGQMIAIDLQEGKLYRDREIKDELAGRRDWKKWVSHGTWLEDLMEEAATQETAELPKEERRRLQMAVGHTLEDLDLILKPMVMEGKEAVGSMGDDTPPAVLSNGYRSLHHFFRQNFSQVTNPPIDSLRERRVMSIYTRLGNLGNILEENRSQCQMLAIESPVITNGEFDALKKFLKKEVSEIDTTFPVEGGPDALKKALEKIRAKAAESVRKGKGHLVLSDMKTGPERAPIPAVLAAGAVNTHLIREGLRSFATINVRSAEVMDVHHIAVLIGVGATTVNPWLAQEAVAAELARGLYGKKTLSECMKNYKKAVGEGLLKIMSKMGIAVISSYRGGSCFEAIGLSRALVAEYLPNIPSRISGIGLRGIQRKVLEQHEKAYGADSAAALPVGGFYRYRETGERHAWEAQAIHLLQSATAKADYKIYKRYADLLYTRPPVQVRDLLGFDTGRVSPAPLHEVEPLTAIRKRFVTPAMSLGALSPEAHGTLNVAMNRIGAKSDSGEGGEDPARYTLDKNGDNWNSAIKQVASGRFGVTAEYLNQARELEIKVAQGAKPGEGGQLPGFKVTELIARLRHSTPGVTLISPPPHHDIYSIEDLAQLIYDLKQINPEAKVCVKLVARTGIGTIAAGVAKAKADVILVSGHVGGTGASPLTSVKFAGIPWEIGLSEVHQVLTMNGLRDRITLRTDGGLKTGRDIVIAALLGAEEFGIGTASLIAMGCLMVRQCHSNTCPVGVCTQDEKLRAMFGGSAEKVINLMSFLAEEVREILAKLGCRSLEEITGRTDLLHQVSHGAPDLDDLDLNPLLVQAAPAGSAKIPYHKERNPVPDTLDARIVADAYPLFERRQKMVLSYEVKNTHRAVGTRLSGLITRKFGMKTLPEGHVTVRLQGSAGQSLGAFACQGVRLEVMGDANDYVGKGLSGATIVVRPMPGSPLKTHENAIIGNTVLYGATSGKLFAAGLAGERFAVRNSGADVVVEGCGSNGCEYMTGGTAVILGPVGANFAAGMTGGMAFVYDPERALSKAVNQESVIHQAVEVDFYEEKLKALIREHAEATGSPWAASILERWAEARGHFRQVIPKDMLGRLDVSPVKADRAATA